MSFELVGAANAPADKLNKNNAAPARTNRSGRSGQIRVSIAHTRRALPRGVLSAASTDLKIGLVALLNGRSNGRRCSATDPVFAFFDQGGKFDRAIVGDFDSRGRAPDAHGRDGSVDLHVTGFCDLAGNESECPFSETAQR